MLAWLTLLIGLSTSLLFGVISATPIQGLSMELQSNRTARGLQAEPYIYSIQILLSRWSFRDYYWDLYLGPYGKKAEPCPLNHGGFKYVTSSEEIPYPRNAIKNPPNPPAMELAFQNFQENDCKWKTLGDGDPGQLICGDWMVMDCERDVSWNDGAINCIGGFSAHRGWACNW